MFWFIILALILGSIAGFVYSFWLLFTVILILAVYFVRWKPYGEQVKNASEIIKRVKLAEEGLIPFPTDEEMKYAAEYLMDSEFSDFRCDDDMLGLDVEMRGFHYPSSLNQFMIPARLKKRNWRNWYGFEFKKNMAGAERELTIRLYNGEDLDWVANDMAIRRRVHPDDIVEMAKSLKINR